MPNRSEPWLDNIVENMKRRKFAAALNELLPLLRSPRLSPLVMEFSVTCYWELRDFETAIALSDLATQTFPAAANLWIQRCNLALGEGRPDFGAECCKQALQIDPQNLHALLALNGISVFSKDSKWAAKIRRSLTKSKHLSVQERAASHNALALIEQNAGDAKRAFYQFERSNKVSKAHYYPDDMEALVAAQIRLFQPCPISTGRPEIVFVGGMPRSGTTLVEAVLSRHPETRCIGESPALRNALTEARRMARAKADQRTEWDWVNLLDDDDIAQLRHRFMTLTGMADDDPRVTVDKMPLNCLDFGLAQRLFPEARFVHMLRHPLACGWSNYSTLFEVGNGFSTRLDWIGHLIRTTLTSAEDYARKLGPLFRFQEYEALVTRPEEEVARLLDFLGLEWNPDCLHPEHAEAIQRTASLLQVRAPINREGLDRWRMFEGHLGPLVKALGGQDWVDAWPDYVCRLQANVTEPKRMTLAS